MRTITLVMQPKKPGYNLRVLEDVGVQNHLADWSASRGAPRRLSAVVGEGKTMRIGLFDGNHLEAVTSVSVNEGQVRYNGARVVPIIGTTWNGLFQDVRIVPSLFSRKEKV